MHRLLRKLVSENVAELNIYNTDTDTFQYAHNGHMGIWAYVKKYGQVGYPRKEHQKCNSETLTSGP